LEQRHGWKKSGKLISTVGVEDLEEKNSKRGAAVDGGE
jgi:hypothetical protein